MPELYDEGRASATPLYDWQSDPTWGAMVERRATPSPQAARHGEGCECPRCPGWYVARERARVPSYSTAPPEQRPRPLVDQVIPVCCLLATVAVCGLVLVPVVVPVLAVGLTAMVVALVVLALTVVGVLAVLGRASVRRDAAQAATVISGEVTRRRRGWR